MLSERPAKTAGETAAAPHPAGSGAVQAAVAALLYGAAAAALMATPILRHFTTARLGDCAPCDPEVYLWSLRWFPYALRHGLQLLFTREVFVPGGYNLAWATAMPGASLIMAPFTAAWGPIAAYNLLSIAAPAMAAFTAFLLCRYLSGAFWASLAGGWLFGFSPYAQLQTIDHLHLALDFVPPLLLLAALMRWSGGLSRAQFAILASALLILQFSLSVEVFSTSVLAGAAALALSHRLAPDGARAAVRRLAGMAALACAAALIVMSPYILRMLAHDFDLLPVFNPAHCSTDLTGFFVPGPYTLLGHWLPLGEIRGCEPAACLGLLPLIAAALLLEDRGNWALRLLAAMLVLTCAAALGPVIHFRDHALLPGPGVVLIPLPLLNNILPARWMMYAFLLMAPALALFLARPDHRALRWTVGIVALVSVAPAIPFRWTVTPYQPSFITQALYRQVIGPNDIVLVLPWGQGGEAMLWQATSGFDFRLAGGYLGGVIPREYRRWPIAAALLRDAPYILHYPDQFRAFLAAHGVRAVIIEEPAAPAYRRLCDSLGVTPRALGGAVIYRLAQSGAVSRKALAPTAGGIDAQAMETHYSVERYGRLIAAARGYLEHGGVPADLDAQVAVTAGLLSSDDIGEPARRQVPGFRWIRWIRESPRFQRMVGWLQRRRPLRYRAAIELGPAGNITATDAGVWAGPWPGKRVAIGEVCWPQAARATIAAFGDFADRIFYPYPAPYADVGGGDGPQFLLMVFNPERLLAANTLKPQ